MIRYDLICSQGHRFDGWFGSISAFDTQAETGLVECPECGDTAVKRALMAPAVSTARSREARAGLNPTRDGSVADGAAAPVENTSAGQSSSVRAGSAMVPVPSPEAMVALAQDQRIQEIVHTMRELKARIVETAEDVGDAFPEEARKIHYGETDERGIYGQASVEDAEELLEEGIAVMPLPVLPEDRN